MESSRWYNGEGICRNVWMLVNSRPDSVWVTLHSDVKDPDGKVLQTLTSTVPVASGEVYYFGQQAKVPSPRRWDVEHPELYGMCWWWMSPLISGPTSFLVRAIVSKITGRRV